MSDTMKICNRHENQVPLLWTFAFPGSEYWCPYCGANYGMLGAGENVPVTMVLKREKVKWKNETRGYLHARAVLASSSTEFEGERMSPDELPQSEKDRLQKVIDNHAYPADQESKNSRSWRQSLEK